MRHCDPPRSADLPLKERNHAALRSQHVSETHSDATHIRTRTRRQDKLSEPLRTSHETRRVNCLIARNKNKATATARLRSVQHRNQTEHVIAQCFRNIALGQWDMFVCSGMEHCGNTEARENCLNSICVVDIGNAEFYL